MRVCLAWYNTTDDWVAAFIADLASAGHTYTQVVPSSVSAVTTAYDADSCDVLFIPGWFSNSDNYRAAVNAGRPIVVIDPGTAESSDFAAGLSYDNGWSTIDVNDTGHYIAGDLNDTSGLTVLTASEYQIKYATVGSLLQIATRGAPADAVIGCWEVGGTYGAGSGTVGARTVLFGVSSSNSSFDEILNADGAALLLRALEWAAGEDVSTAEGDAATVGGGTSEGAGTSTITGEGVSDGGGTTAAAGTSTITGETASAGGGASLGEGAPTITGTTTAEGGGITAAEGTSTITGEASTEGGGTSAASDLYTLTGEATTEGGGTTTGAGSSVAAGEAASVGGGTSEAAGEATTTGEAASTGGGETLASGAPTVTGEASTEGGGSTYGVDFTAPDYSRPPLARFVIAARGPARFQFAPRMARRTVVAPAGGSRSVRA